MRNVRIGAVSFLVNDLPHTVELNIARACGYIADAAHAGCDLVVLPEMFRTVNTPGGEIDPEALEGPTAVAIAAAAVAGRVNVVAPYYVASDGRIYNQATVFDRNGNVVGWYRKVQPTGAEACSVHAGDELPVFDLDFGRIAVMICMDIYFPEIARVYAHKGAEIICWPTVTHGPTQDGLLAQVRSRAIDNAVIIAEANYSEGPPYAPYNGHARPGTARILDAAGDVIAATGRRAGLAIANVDLAEERLTSFTVLLREPDHFRADMERLTRLELYAREYAMLAAARGGSNPYKQLIANPGDDVID